MEAHAPLLAGAPLRGRPPLRLGRQTDERLAWLVGRGDQSAFVTLYERYHQILYRYCRAILRADVDAQDALQSTFASAYVALEREQRDSPVRPWLFRIAHNESISLLRRRHPHNELPELADRASCSPQDRLEQRERLSLLLEDLHELPDRQRQALLLRELSGLPYNEIADALSTSTGSIKRTIFDARQALSDFQAGRDTSCEEICRRLSYADRRMLRGRRISGHLRQCPSCAAFAQAIPARQRQLRALTLPLPAAGAAKVLSRLGIGGSASAGGSALGGGGAGGIGAALSGTLLTKAAGLVLLATAAVGVTTTLPQGSAPPAAGVAGGSLDRSSTSLPVLQPPVRATSGASGSLAATAKAATPAAHAPAVSSTGTVPSSQTLPAAPVTGVAGAPSTRQIPAARATGRGSAAPTQHAVRALPIRRPSTPGGAAGSYPSDTAPVAASGGSGAAPQAQIGAQPAGPSSGSPAPAAQGATSAAGGATATTPAPGSRQAAAATPGQAPKRAA